MSRRASIRHRLAVLTDLARKNVRRRQTLRGQSKAYAVIGAALAETGLDSSRVSGLRLVAGAADALARLGDTLRQRRADAAFIAGDALLCRRPRWDADIAARVPRFVGRPPPDFGASLFDWYAWSLALRPRRPIRVSSPRATLPREGRFAPLNRRKSQAMSG